MEALALNNVSIQAWGKQLLSDISFIINPGDLVSIIGPNGAGKSSLINALATIEDHRPYQITGDISICGKSYTDAKSWSATERARHVALLPQQNTLNFPFTVNEVLTFSRNPHTTGVTIDKSVITEVLHALDIDHLKDRLYTELSGGEKQRVQLGRVMAQIWRSEDADQRLLLLDEPTTSLDMGHQQQLMQIVKWFSERQVTVLLVMHDVNLVTQYMDKVIALQDGQLFLQGTVEQVITAESIKALFGANCQVNQHPTNARPIVVYK